MGDDRRVPEVQIRLDHPGSRRLQRRLGQLDLGPLDELTVPERCLGGLDVCHGHLFLGERHVQVLLGNGPGLDKGAVAIDVLLHLVELGVALIDAGACPVHDGGVAGPREIRLRLGDLRARGLEGRHILLALEREQGLALLDLGALLEEHLLEHAGHASADLDGRDALGARGEIPEDRDRALCHFGDDNCRWRRRRRGRTLSVLPGLGPVTRGRGEQKERE